MSQFSRDINSIDRFLREKRREYMEPLGLKGIHARLFMRICGTPGQSQDQIAKRMGFDKSTIGRQVELLEEKGFVERRPSETDKRVLCVFPTQKMLEFQTGLKAAMDDWDEELLQQLTPEEKEQLFVILGKVRAVIGKESVT